MKARFKFFICFIILACHLLAGCGGSKKKVAEPTTKPTTDTQTGAGAGTGGDTGLPASGGFDPGDASTDPLGETTAGESEESGTGEEIDDTTPINNATATTSTTTTQGIGTGLPTNGNPLTSLVTLIKNPQEGMKTLISTLIGVFKGQTSGGGTGSLISILFGGLKSNTLPVNPNSQQTNTPTPTSTPTPVPKP